jgi:ABC-2 family transporter
MTAALLRKEIRQLLPWGILGLALGLSDVVELLLAQVDMTPLGKTFRLLNNEDLVLYWFIAFAIGTGLAIREHDDRTLSFLDGLPVSRTRVFFVKCAVMSAFVLIGPLIELVAIVALHLLSRGSLDHALHGALLLDAWGLQALVLFNGLMLGAAFGLLRSLTWLVAGVTAAALLLLADRLPRAALLNPLKLLEWEWTASGIVVDGETVRVQMAAAAIAALVAWRGFMRAGKARPLIVSGPIASALVVVATVAVGATVLLLVMRPMEQVVRSEAAVPPRYEFAPSPPAQTLTRHYRFSYPAHRTEAALELAGEADTVFERVHELLGLVPGDVIDVDASGSMRNTHGTAFLGRLRMELDSEVLAVLAHETAHVAAQRAAGEERGWLWQAADVLNEGLASWVETRFRERVERTDERMLVLAAMHARRELRIEELADPAVFRRVRDEELKYAAGEALIAALVRLEGEAAVPRLLRAFADPRLPSDLRGMPLWQSAFQLAGFDLGAVVDEFYRGVTDYGALHAEEISALPRPRVVLVRVRNRFGAMAVLDPPHADNEALRLVVRFRPGPDSELSDYRRFPASANEPVWPEARNLSGSRICVQPGVHVGDEVLYEPWVCLPTSEAIDYEDMVRERAAGIEEAL